ncbi:hypothetical protein PHYC_00901 [Phycisphaerales bacterium]|nr:hypothetical protein PHYC_00901 [Phycisphaerales bacterium]
MREAAANEGESNAGDVTRLLVAIERGEAGATDQLLPLVYDELRRLAAARLGGERPGHTLQPTALVHEAYLRLIGDSQVRWESHAHFFGAAAIAMRRILIERARRKRPDKGGPAMATEIRDDTDPEHVDLLALNDALDKLSKMDARLTDVVHLRFFAGLTVEQTADVLKSSPRTVKRDWNFAKAWLKRELAGVTASEES